MDSSIDQLLTWAETQGIKLNGIIPQALPNRGIGIVASHHLKPNETVLTVPPSALRTLGNTPKPLVQALKGASVHAILAASLSLDLTSSSLPTPWRSVLPSRSDIDTSLPIRWSPPFSSTLLPSRASSLLSAQRAKLDRDWAAVSSASLPIDIDSFTYAWLLVNTRTFYHTDAAVRAARLPREDHMALQPVADLLNHSPSPSRCCAVAYDPLAGFTFTTSSSHEPGDELFIRYGPHSNDLLLVEYGFTLEGNPFDETCLDGYVCPRFSPPEREALRQVGFWGRYMLDAETACYRTQVALRALCLPEDVWRAVLDGERDEDRDREVVDAELLKILRTYEKDVHRTLREIDDLVVKDKAMKSSLRERWIQIKQLLVLAISRLTA